jgi:hypothetical protein
LPRQRSVPGLGPKISAAQAKHQRPRLANARVAAVPILASLLASLLVSMPTPILRLLLASPRRPLLPWLAASLAIAGHLCQAASLPRRETQLTAAVRMR